jgi:flagellar biogenesis protein FliO
MNRVFVSATWALAILMGIAWVVVRLQERNLVREVETMLHDSSRRIN